MMEWFHPPHPAHEDVAADTGSLLGQPYFCIPWDKCWEDTNRKTEGSARKTRGVGKPACSCLVDCHASIFWGTPTREDPPSKKELVPKATAGAKVLLNYGWTVSTVESVRDYVLNDGRLVMDRHAGALAVLKTMSAIAIISTFDFSYIFPPKTCTIFWLFLLLIDLPLSTGWQDMPQTIEFITVHCATTLHHSALPSSVP